MDLQSGLGAPPIPVPLEPTNLQLWLAVDISQGNAASSSILSQLGRSRLGPVLLGVRRLQSRPLCFSPWLCAPLSAVCVPVARSPIVALSAYHFSASHKLVLPGFPPGVHVVRPMLPAESAMYRLGPTMILLRFVFSAFSPGFSLSGVRFSRRFLRTLFPFCSPGWRAGSSSYDFIPFSGVGPAESQVALQWGSCTYGDVLASLLPSVFTPCPFLVLDVVVSKFTLYQVQVEDGSSYYRVKVEREINFLSINVIAYSSGSTADDHVITHHHQEGLSLELSLGQLNVERADN
ncbi:hypothetical protein GOBAR_DD27886 [Gossypium barbadense]|nr:hypothetical protein GOBAR_DD27886 [Gossypium barbadense]